MEPLLEASDRRSVSMAEDPLVRVRLSSYLLRSEHPQVVDVPFDAFIADHLTLASLASNREDQSLVSSERPGARHVSPSKVSSLSNTNTGVAQDHDPLLKIEPLASSPSINRSCNVPFQERRQPVPLCLREVWSCVSLSRGQNEFRDLSDVPASPRELHYLIYNRALPAKRRDGRPRL